MTKAELEKAKFLLVSHDPNGLHTRVFSTELIWERSETSVTTINVKTFLKVTYEIRMTKDEKVIFPNIPEVKAGEYSNLCGIRDWIIERRRDLINQLDEKREAHNKVLTDAKEFEGFCKKLSKKLPHDFKE